MFGMIVTYWKEKRTGYVYKYYNGNRPFMWETDWKQVSVYEYDRQFK